MGRPDRHQSVLDLRELPRPAAEAAAWSRSVARLLRYWRSGRLAHTDANFDLILLEADKAARWSALAERAESLSSESRR